MMLSSLRLVSVASLAVFSVGCASPTTPNETQHLPVLRLPQAYRVAQHCINVTKWE